VHDELAVKSLPAAHSFCSLTADNLVVTALKQAEREQSAILRVVEMDGAPAKGQVEFLGSACDSPQINLLEEEHGDGASGGADIKPYEIRTMRLPLKNGL